MSSRALTYVALVYGCLGIVACAAVDAFGMLRGLGVVAAVWLLMPPAR